MVTRNGLGLELPATMASAAGRLPQISPDRSPVFRNEALAGLVAAGKDCAEHHDYPALPERISSASTTTLGYDENYSGKNVSRPVPTT